MSDKDDLLKMGNDILNQVTNAIDTGDYSNLGNSIRDQVRVAVNRASSNPGQNFQGRASTTRTVNYASGRFRTPFFMKKNSNAGGILKIVFGILGVIFTGFWALISLVASFAEPAAIGAVIVFGALTLALAFLIKSGVDDDKLLKSFNQYGQILGNAEYFAIDDLALVAGEKTEKTKKNLLKMIKKGFFHTARMDSQETTVMLTPRAYEKYIKAELSRRDREAQEAAQTRTSNVIQAQVAKEAGAAGVIKEGNEYIANIRRINDMIPGDEMSEKLYRLESIMQRIFSQVEKQPECADDLRKFLNYYLPTTTKLLNAYVDLDRQPEVGNNIAKTKKEIEDTIDVINDAFENLLDSLFQDMAWDISSDISVMKTMMAQDGLTNDGIRSGAVPNPGAVQAQAMPQSMPQDQPLAQAMPQAAQQSQTAGQAAESEKYRTELKF